MEDRRKEERLNHENEIAVTLIDDEKTPVKGKRLNNQSLDISVSGAKIQSNTPLPVDTLIRIKIKLKKIGKRITTIGKVKWTNGLSMNKFYEAGVEFVDTSCKSILVLEEYIASYQSILVLEEYISRGVDR